MICINIRKNFLTLLPERGEVVGYVYNIVVREVYIGQTCSQDCCLSAGFGEYQILNFRWVEL